MTPLMTRTEAQTLAEKTLKLVTADDATVSIGDGRSATTRYANNAITQNVVTGGKSLTVTVAFGRQRGSASAATLEPDAIAEAVRRAERIARLAPPDPEYLPPLGPQIYPLVRAYHEGTARLTPVERARRVLAVTERAKRAGFQAAGTVESGESATAIATSKGLFAYHRETNALVGCTITAKNSNGWARDAAPDMTLLDPTALADDAITQARVAAHPQTLAPGRYTTILMPAAVGYFVGPLIGGLDARTTGEGLTYLSGKVGQKLVSDKITLRSEPGSRRVPGTPFDGSGVPTRAKTWIDKGVIGRELLYDRFTAQKAGVTPVPFPGALILDGTEKSATDLVKSTERGVLITHVWYVRSIKADETLQTGMTRDALFWIEDGKIKHGLKHMRWNESALGVFSRVLDLSRPLPNVDSETSLTLLPALKVADFHFVSGTEF